MIGNNSSSTSPSSARSRFRGLDGLRGIAAVVVMIDHILLCSPVLAATSSARQTGLSLPTSLLAYSPLHLIWAGREAVLVFFVLSGFVLTHAMLGSRRPSWIDYYPRRVVRLYVPTVAALVLVLPMAHWLRPDSPEPGASSFYNAHAATGTLHNLVADAPLWHQRASLLDGPLWSLHWEVVFSLLLPAYLLLTLIAQRAAAALAAVGLLAVVVWGVHSGSGNATFLPIFGLGVLAAAHQERLRELARGWSLALMAVGALLLTAHWTTTGVTDVSRWTGSLLIGLAVLGAGLVVLAFLDGACGRWAEASAVVRWLGKRSFSLYLVHVPIIISTAYVLGGHPSVWLLLVLCPPLCFAGAELFGRLVEMPAHQLSKRVGSAAERHLGRPARGVRSEADPSVEVGAEGIEPPTTRV